LLLLRATELGLSLNDLEQITIGMLYDLLFEKIRDNIEEDNPIRKATQSDFDNF